ncbi:MAG TPA: TonB family protein [Saprospiraceae bacterium]|nr:TonB family protein [Saprospiraceae bacterium]
MATHEFVSPPGDTLEIIFAHRNRAYGAYQLRRAYPRYLGRALGIGLLLIGFGLALPQILNALDSKFAEPVYVDMTRELAPPPDIDPEIPPPPPPPPLPTPPPPVQATIRFVPPTPTPDELVQDEHPPAVEKILDSDADVSTKNRASDDDAPPSLDAAKDIPRGVETAVAQPDDDEYTTGGVQKMPTFPGGDRELMQYLADNIKYPALARENNIQGTVALSFLVNKDGTVSDISIVKEIGGGCGKEAMRVVQSMPRWMPGEANGHAVKVRFTLPVRFRLQ